MSKSCKYVLSGVIRAVPFHFTLKSRYTWLSQFALHSNLEHWIFVSSLSDQAQKLFYIYSNSMYSDVFFFSNIIEHHSAVYYPHAHQPLRSSSERRRRKKKKEKSLYKSKKASSRPSHLFQPSLDEVAEQVWFYYNILSYNSGSLTLKLDE